MSIKVGDICVVQDASQATKFVDGVMVEHSCYKEKVKVLAITSPNLPVKPLGVSACLETRRKNDTIVLDCKTNEIIFTNQRFLEQYNPDPQIGDTGYINDNSYSLKWVKGERKHHDFGDQRHPIKILHFQKGLPDYRDGTYAKDEFNINDIIVLDLVTNEIVFTRQLFFVRNAIS
jgi:hypothetical protein